MKKLANILLAGVIATSVFAGVACAPKRQKADANTLKVYAMEAGYGVEWVEPLLNAFKNQAWVQEKYPNLKVVKPTYNDLTTFAQTQLDAGESVNDFSILFGTYLDAYSGQNAQGKQDLADLTDTVYNKTVPGETITYKQKIFGSFLDYLGYTPKGTNDTRYYVTPWASGMDSIVYNQDILDQLGKKMPVTTDELLELCAYVRQHGYTAKDPTTGETKTIYTSFLQGKQGGGYPNYMFGTWWAQYETVERFYDFWNGKVDGVVSRGIFLQEGRLYSAQVIEQIADYRFNPATQESESYVNLQGYDIEFMEAQTMVLQGFSLFNANGDWFDSEMYEMAQRIKNKGQKVGNIKIMPTPIISNIIDFTDSINSDEKLQEVVRAIDKGETSVAGVTAEDFQAIKDARKIVHSIGPAHTAAVPDYSLSKDVAMDFLLFMATDEAQKIYMESTRGASLPFVYDVKTKSPETYMNKITSFHRDRLDYVSRCEGGVYALPMPNNFPLVKYGGLYATSFADNSGLFVTFGQKNKAKTAQDMYDETITLWTQDKWNQAVATAGINQ